MLTIGVTGHRPHRLLVPERKLEARVRSVLSGLAKAVAAGTNPPVQDAAGPRLDINSALAEGADQIAARMALDLGCHLTALLPFGRADYEATFGDPAHIRPFRALLRAAGKRVVLDARAANAEAAYVAVGMLTVARADIVLTIWDGKPAQGRGGTPEILTAALVWGIPIIWIDAAADRKPVLIRATPRADQPPVLTRAAQRAVPLTAALCRQLTARVFPGKV